METFRGYSFGVILDLSACLRIQCGQYHAYPLSFPNSRSWLESSSTDGMTGVLLIGIEQLAIAVRDKCTNQAVSQTGIEYLNID